MFAPIDGNLIPLVSKGQIEANVTLKMPKKDWSGLFVKQTTASKFRKYNLSLSNVLQLKVAVYIQRENFFREINLPVSSYKQKNNFRKRVI